MAQRSRIDTEQLNIYIPPHLQGGLLRYLEHGIMPGGFMQAVLENKLKESFERADDISRDALPDIVHYLYNHVPQAAWGSPERVQEWTERVRSGKLNSQARRTGDSSHAFQPELQEGLQAGGQDGQETR